VPPSVVIGRGGASAKMMVALASLPVMPRFGSDDWRFQPIHLGDLAEMVLRLAESDDAPPRQIDAVGPLPMNSCETLVALREWLGLSKGLFFLLPEALLFAMASVGERFVDAPLNRDVIRMLSRGNTADAAPVSAVQDRAPRPSAEL
jgi:uncharacterized protein YbjT (DUF2867 family)